MSDNPILTNWRYTENSEREKNGNAETNDDEDPANI